MFVRLNFQYFFNENFTKFCSLRQGPALEGRNSPVFAKRFRKGNK